MYVWTTEYTYKSSTLPTFHVHKQLKDTVIHVVKPRKGSSLMYRWDIGHGSIQQFDFSPDTNHLAVVNQDGFLRVYNFTTQELYGRMRSYYGGFLCVCWSPDGRYVVTGGEDDLVSVWSFEEKATLARGQGHKSYVNRVAFDPYTSETDSIPSNHPSMADLSLGSGPELKSQRSSRFFTEENRSYRLGSVGQDGLLCLWELSGDSLCIVRRLHGRSRSRIKYNSSSQIEGSMKEKEGDSKTVIVDPSKSLSLTEDVRDSILSTASVGSDISKKSEDKSGKSKKKHKKKKHKDTSDEIADSVELQSPVDQSKRISSTTEGGGDDTTSSSGNSSKESKKNKSNSEKSHKKFSMKKTVTKLMGGGAGGTPNSRRLVSQFESCHSDDIALSMQDVNLIEPLVCKKVWYERLTDVMFREDSMLVATQDGFVQVWGRPEFIDDPTPSVSSNPGVSSF